MAKFKILSAAAFCQCWSQRPCSHRRRSRSRAHSHSTVPTQTSSIPVSPRRGQPQGPWHRYGSAPATLMPRWIAMWTHPLAPSATVPTIRDRLRSLAMMASGIRVSDAALKKAAQTSRLLRFSDVTPPHAFGDRGNDRNGRPGGQRPRSGFPEPRPRPESRR